MSYADLHMGNAMPTYSEYGYGYAVEKAPTTKGWSYPVFEELWNYGSAAGDAAFRPLRPRQGDAAMATGEDGRVVQEAIVRRLRVGRPGPQDRVAVPSEGRQAADRLMVGKVARTPLA